MIHTDRKLLRYFHGHGWALATALLLVAVVGVLEAASSILIAPVFDSFLGTSRTPPIPVPLLGIQVDFSIYSGTFLLALLVISTIAKTSSEYGAVTATAYLGQAVVRDLRNDVFEKILNQPLSFFEQNPTGELISRVSADVERVQTAASET